MTVINRLFISYYFDMAQFFRCERYTDLQHDEHYPA